MTPNRELSETESIRELIQEIASDAAHDVLCDILPSINQQQPDDLPVETLQSVCEDFRTDMDRLIQNRLQWLIQSIHAEANELRRVQQQDSYRQALYDSQPIQTRQSISKPQKVNSNRKTAQRALPCHESTNNSSQTLSQLMFQQSEPFASQPDADTPRPQRRRRRSAATIAI
jgi:hypothetical protein